MALVDAIVKITLSCVDNASKSIKDATNSISSSTEKLSSTLKNVGKVGATSFAAITGVMTSTIKAYQAQEKAEARLEQIAKQVTNATDEEIQSFKNLASAIQNYGVVGDEVLIAGQSQIASFTKSSKVIQELSDDLADLAVAQYGINVSQEQMIQTGNLMGKALQGNLGALTKTGILVSGEYKKAFEEANTEEERAIVLSKIIQDNYGGLNAKMRETSEGGLQALKNSRGDLCEVVGQAFIPILQDLIDIASPIISKRQKRFTENQNLTKNIAKFGLIISGVLIALGGIGTALMPVIKAFSVLKGVFSAISGVIGFISGGLGSLGPIISFLTGPIGIVVAALTALGVAYATNLGGFRDFVNGIWAELQPIFEEIGTVIFEVFQSIWDVVQEVWGELEPILTPIRENFGQVLEFVLNFVAEVVKATFQAIGELVKGFVNIFQGIIDFFKNVFTGNWSGALDSLRGIATARYEGIINVFKAFNIDLPGIIETLKNTISELRSGMFNGLKSICSGAIDRMSSKISKIRDKIQSAKDSIASLWGGGSSSNKNRASGGLVLAGQTYRVNEIHGEYFTPMVNGMVTPAPAMNNNPNFSINFTGDINVRNQDDINNFSQKVREVVMDVYKNLATGTY